MGECRNDTLSTWEIIWLRRSFSEIVNSNFHQKKNNSSDLNSNRLRDRFVCALEKKLKHAICSVVELSGTDTREGITILLA